VSFTPGTKQKVGRAPGRERRLGFTVDFILCGLDELDLLAGLLLEGGDDLRDRLVLLWVKTLLSPDDQVGGLRAERRHHERRGEDNGLPAHDVASRPRSRALINCG
jgi:hypothetical protein